MQGVLWNPAQFTRELPGDLLVLKADPPPLQPRGKPVIRVRRQKTGLHGCMFGVGPTISPYKNSANYRKKKKKKIPPSSLGREKELQQKN